MDIVGVTPTSPRWHGLWETYNTVRRELMGPGAPVVDAAAEAGNDARFGSLSHWWATVVDDTVVAVCRAYVRRQDTPRTGWADVAVLPGHRRQGLGDALVNVAHEWLLEHGVAWITSGVEVRADDTCAEQRARAFAARHGYQPQRVDISRELALPLRADAPPPSGVVIDVAASPGPAIWHDQLAELLAVLWRDQPHGTQPMAQRQATAETVVRRLGPSSVGDRAWLGVARDVGTGRIVGYTTLSVQRAQPELAHQGDTVVAVEQRGRGIAAALKAATIRRAHHDEPDLMRVLTCNPSTNTAMIGVNERLGFRATGRSLQWRKAGAGH